MRFSVALQKYVPDFPETTSPNAENLTKTQRIIALAVLGGMLILMIVFLWIAHNYGVYGVIR